MFAMAASHKVSRSAGGLHFLPISGKAVVYVGALYRETFTAAFVLASCTVCNWQVNLSTQNPGSFATAASDSLSESAEAALWAPLPQSSGMCPAHRGFHSCSWTRHASDCSPYKESTLSEKLHASESLFCISTHER